MATYRVVRSLKDLEVYGVEFLTGEVDNYYLHRSLCRLNGAGQRLMHDYFGGTVTVGSEIMIPHDILQSIAVFATLHVDEFDYVRVSKRDGRIDGFNESKLFEATMGVLTDREALLDSDLYEVHRNAPKRAREKAGL